MEMHWVLMRSQVKPSGQRGLQRGAAVQTSPSPSNPALQAHAVSPPTPVNTAMELFSSFHGNSLTRCTSGVNMADSASTGINLGAGKSITNIATLTSAVCSLCHEIWCTGGVNMAGDVSTRVNLGAGKSITNKAISTSAVCSLCHEIWYTGGVNMAGDVSTGINLGAGKSITNIAILTSAVCSLCHEIWYTGGVNMAGDVSTGINLGAGKSITNIAISTSAVCSLCHEIWHTGGVNMAGDVSTRVNLGAGKSITNKATLTSAVYSLCDKVWHTDCILVAIRRLGARVEERVTRFTCTSETFMTSTHCVLVHQQTRCVPITVVISQRAGVWRSREGEERERITSQIL